MPQRSWVASPKFWLTGPPWKWCPSQNEDPFHEGARRQERFSLHVAAGRARPGSQRSRRAGAGHLRPPHRDRRRWVDAGGRAVRRRCRRHDPALQLRRQHGRDVGQWHAVRRRVPDSARPRGGRGARAHRRRGEDLAPAETARAGVRIRNEHGPAGSHGGEIRAGTLLGSARRHAAVGGQSAMRGVVGFLRFRLAYAGRRKPTPRALPQPHQRVVREGGGRAHDRRAVLGARGRGDDEQRYGVDGRRRDGGGAGIGKLAGARADAGRPDRSALRRRRLPYGPGGDRGGGRVLSGVGKGRVSSPQRGISTRRRGGAEQDAEKTVKSKRESAESAENAEESELRSDAQGGALCHWTLLCLAVPDAAAERGDVDLAAILRIHGYAVAPFEIEARDALPGQAAVGAPPRGGFDAGGVQYARVLRVDSDVIAVPILIEHAAPACAAIGGEVDAAIGRAFGRAAAPGGEVEARRVLRIDGETVGPVQPR